MKKVDVYIGCGLTYATEEFKLQIEQFKDELKKENWINVLDFLGKTGSKSFTTGNRALDVYTHDIHVCVKKATVIIADLTVNSTGLGYELGVCVEKKDIRTIMCAKNDATVSHLLLGVPFHTDNDHVTFNMYENSILELLPYFKTEIAKLL